MSVTRPAGRVLAVCVCIFCGCGPKPENLFPDFASQKSHLGAVALVADVVVVEDLVGGTEHVYLEDCKDLGTEVIDYFDEGLRARGISVEAKPLLCVGQVVDPDSKYRILSTPSRKDEEIADAPIMAPPFYFDAGLAGTEDAQAAWGSVLTTAWSYQKDKNEPAAVFPEVPALQDELGTDSVFIVQVVGKKIPFGKQLGQALLSGLLSGGASSGDFTFSAGVDLTQFSGTAVKITVVDCASGQVLWTDGHYEDKNLKPGAIQKIGDDVLERLP